MISNFKKKTKDVNENKFDCVIQ